MFQFWAGRFQFWAGRFQGPQPILLPRKHIRSLTKLRLKSALLVESQYHASGEEIRCISWQKKFHFRVHRSPGSSTEHLVGKPYSHTAFFIEDYSYFYMWASLAAPFLRGFSLKYFMYFSSAYVRSHNSLRALIKLSQFTNYTHKSMDFHHSYMFRCVCAILREFRTSN